MNQGAEIHTPSKSDPCYYYLESFYPAGTHFDEEDIDILNRGIQLLKRVAGFGIARDIERVLANMKYTRYSEISENDYIAFEDHTQAAGTEWLDKLAEAIHMKSVVILEYKSFTQPGEKFLFHPYFLKEYRNRWFVFGRHQVRNVLFTLALDRIRSLKPSLADSYIANDLFVPSDYFTDLIGVTRPAGSAPETVRLVVYAESAMHVETKKIHHSQKLIRKNEDGSIEIELKVIVNYELISTLLGFGAAVKVLGPEGVVDKCKEELTNSIARYNVS